MRPLLVLSIVAQASLLAPATLTAQQARVDSLFSRYDATPSPGLAIAVVKDGRLVLSKGYGLASLEHRVPITGTTVFDIASVSKQFAGLAVAMLVAEGKMDLDADIAQYIPEMRPLTSKHAITVRHLLHHTSGLRDWPATLAIAGWRMDDVVAFDQILRFAYAQRTLNFTPGSEYTYSNTGYNLLAEAVARVSGKSFGEFTRERIFSPLGMSDSHFQDDHGTVVANRAFGYGVAGGSFTLAADNLTALGSSSLFSTVEDLAKWVVNFETAAVGGRQVMAMARTRGVLNSGDTIAYAFGLSHGRHRGLPTISHGGSWAQFATYLIHFPEQRLGVVVLANSGSINASRAAFDIADAFLGPQAVAAAPDTSLRARPTIALPARTLDEYAGVYRLGPGWYLTIVRDGNALRTRATNEDEFAMLAKSEREFWVDAYNNGIVFRRDLSGRVTSITYRNARAPRIEAAALGPAPSERELAALAGTYESAELGTSYELRVKDGKLVASHFRHGEAPLTWAVAEFTTPWWFLRSITFERGPGGGVTGMVVDLGERSRNIRFGRVGPK